MTDTDDIERRLKAFRTGSDTRGPLRALLIGQAWLWHRGGMVLALLIALMIAALTLSPLPLGRMTADGLDKVYHFLAFAALVFPLILTDSRRWRWAVPLTIAYGGAIELIQPGFGRTAEWLDWGADITGVLAGAALAEILHDRIRARFFAVPQGLTAPETDGEARHVEEMRAELMTELRAVLREELATIRSPAEGAQTSDETDASARPDARDDPRSLRH